MTSTWLADGWTVTWRNLLKFRRSPDYVVFAVLQPIMFVLLFSQVYGGSIRVEGTNYTDYLMAGIFGQTVLFGATFSGFGMAQDLKDGIIDRFRTISMVIMILTGLVVGWRFHGTVVEFLAGVALLLLFSYSFSWVMALLGMLVRSPEVINNAAFMVLFPLTFISNAFVQTQNLPGPLEAFANWNPVSALVQAARELFGNVGDAPVPDVFPTQHSVAMVVVGSALLLVVFVPLAVARYSRTTGR